MSFFCFSPIMPKKGRKRVSQSCRRKYHYAKQPGKRVDEHGYASVHTPVIIGLVLILWWHNFLENSRLEAVKSNKSDQQLCLHPFLNDTAHTIIVWPTFMHSNACWYKTGCEVGQCCHSSQEGPSIPDLHESWQIRPILPKFSCLTTQNTVTACKNE